MAERRQKVSIVFPVLNEKDNIEHLYAQVKEACSEAKADYEMIFVDDGSTDGSLDVIKGLRAKDDKVHYVSFSRNFGHQISFFAGMSKATGDGVITMDADLQHPPSLIPKMIQLWRDGADVVYTTKAKANLGRVKNTIVKASYWFISKISGLRLEFGQSDFRLIDRKVLKVILGMPECHKFLRGQVRWVGFRQEGISYNVEKRHAGTPKFSYKSLYGLALDGIFSFGRYPLHLVMVLGLGVLSLSAIYIFLILTIWLLKIAGIVRIPMPPGWTTLSVGMFLIGSLQLIAIGIVSEYVGRIYEQAKGRPVYVTNESSFKD